MRFGPAILPLTLNPVLLLICSFVFRRPRLRKYGSCPKAKDLQKLRRLRVYRMLRPGFWAQSPGGLAWVQGYDIQVCIQISCDSTLDTVPTHKQFLKGKYSGLDMSVLQLLSGRKE